MLICTVLSGLITYKFKSLKNETSETAKGDARWMNNKDLKKLVRSSEIYKIREDELEKLKKSGVILAKVGKNYYIDNATVFSITQTSTSTGTAKC